jgi:hypothetical protein
MPVEMLRAALTNQKLTRPFPSIGHSLRANPGAQLGYRMTVADERESVQEPRGFVLRYYAGDWRRLWAWKAVATRNLTLAADHAGIDAGAQAPPPKVVGERHIFAAGRRAMEKC